MDMSIYVSELPVKIRQAVIDNLPEGCRPDDDCESGCATVFFCDEDVAWPLEESCPKGIYVTFKGFGRRLDKSNCSAIRWIDFHVRFTTGCFPIDPAQSCEVEEAVASTIACGYFFECALDNITPVQTGLQNNMAGGCNFVEIVGPTKCLLEGNCAGFETLIRVTLP